MKTSAINGPGFQIGTGQRCFIIAEAGVNHNGDLGTAKALVDAAIAAKADAVKFQTWITEKLVVPTAAAAAYQMRRVPEQCSQFELLRRLELTQAAFQELKRYCDANGILFMSTPDEEESADFLVALGVAVIKIGSGEVSNLPYLAHVARKNKPLILSTGMSTLGEVESAVRAIEGEGNHAICLLHCVSEYPANPCHCNLKAMDTLAAAFGYPVGFSDHTQGVDAAIAAVSRGACIIEKHLTLDRAMAGPDHHASATPQEFCELVDRVRVVEGMLGDGIKRPTDEELEILKVVRKVVVSSRDLHGGDEIRPADMALRRAADGLAPSCAQLLVGRRAACVIPSGTAIQWSMIR